MFNYKREAEQQHIINDTARVKIIEASEAVSKAGTEMIKIRFKLSNSRGTIYYYILNNEYANKKLTQLYDSFTKIPEGNMDYDKWCGEIGVAKLKKNDRGYWEIQKLLTPDKGAELPDYIDIPIDSEPKEMKVEETNNEDLPF